MEVAPIDPSMYALASFAIVSIGPTHVTPMDPAVDEPVPVDRAHYYCQGTTFPPPTHPGMQRHRRHGHRLGFIE